VAGDERGQALAGLERGQCEGRAPLVCRLRHAVEYADVVMPMRIKTHAEAVRDAHRPEPGTGTRSRTRLASFTVPVGEGL
jgi:hypothetical protein